jgi:DNA processing protein
MAERTEHAACARCLRRSWLLGELSAVLDCNSRADGRLLALLALDDEALIAAIGGRRRTELRRRHTELGGQEEASVDGVEGISTLCRHDRRYPPGLLHPAAPHLLHMAGSPERLRALTAQPVVAFLACTRPTDYGLELSRAIARELAAGGVTVAASRGAGIARAALAGALDADGATLCVLGNGLGAGVASARRSAERERSRQAGCTLSELPCGVSGRRWGANAAERTVASLADLVLVVEAEESPLALASARLAAGLGKTLAACPGRVTSRASSGSHLLLREGARLVRNATDLLDLLYGVGSQRPAPPPAPLSAKLRAVLEQVGAGVDTPGKLTAGSADAGELLQALGELEALGLLRRGDGGRYLACSGRS